MSPVATVNVTTSRNEKETPSAATLATVSDKVTDEPPTMEKLMGTVEDYYATVITNDVTRIRYGRFGNGVTAAFSSFKFFCLATGRFWTNKETRLVAEVAWAAFSRNAAVVEKVSELKNCHLVSVTNRMTCSIRKGLRHIKMMRYERTGSLEEEKQYYAGAILQAELRNNRVK